MNCTTYHELSRKTKKYFQVNTNENQNVWNVAKTVISSTLNGIKGFYLKRKSQITKLSFYLKKIEKDM